jgi:hypothetical protein
MVGGSEMAAAAVTKAAKLSRVCSVLSAVPPRGRNGDVNGTTAVVKQLKIYVLYI